MHSTRLTIPAADLRPPAVIEQLLDSICEVVDLAAVDTPLETLEDLLALLDKQC